ncbi:hypothetical protein AXG93_1062s1200 [Marchantia polymorpha subsp. ruderalis]|uniref:Uncharacterized protein n=1 Tax=Marchantia polymorpha subsp. ruderalis TaxID=1480154 RepID=A0A176W4P7_MARPO|nr:hypothetical protein AXG93_1062s1200 [Marchantia polymorpha subsp. ruderalis]
MAAKTDFNRHHHVAKPSRNDEALAQHNKSSSRGSRSTSGKWRNAASSAGRRKKAATREKPCPVPRWQRLQFDNYERQSFRAVLHYQRTVKQETIAPQGAAAAAAEANGRKMRRSDGLGRTDEQVLFKFPRMTCPDWAPLTGAQRAHLHSYMASGDALQWSGRAEPKPPQGTTKVFSIFPVGFRVPACLPACLPDGEGTALLLLLLLPLPSDTPGTQTPDPASPVLQR